MCLIYAAMSISCVRRTTDESAHLRDSRRVVRQAAIDRLSKASRAATPAEIDAMIDGLRNEKMVALPGPPVLPTEATAFLIAHGSETRVALERALLSDDPNVRRHSAYALGKIRSASSIPALRAALVREFDRLLQPHAPPADERIERFPLRAMIGAYGAIDRDDAMKWLLSLRKYDRGPAADLLQRSLGEIRDDGPICKPAEVDSGACIDRWRQWLATAGAKPAFTGGGADMIESKWRAPRFVSTPSRPPRSPRSSIESVTKRS